MNKLSPMMISAAMAMVGPLAGSGILPAKRNDDCPDFDVRGCGSKGKHGGRPRREKRSKTKAQRKARKRNRK